MWYWNNRNDSLTKVKQVIGVESNKDAIKDAKNNARMNQLSNIQFVCDDATEFMKKLAKEKHKVDVVIMDPPRSGSTKQFMDSVKILNPKQVVYISCDPTTQIRDIQYLKRLVIILIQCIFMICFHIQDMLRR